MYILFRDGKELMRGTEFQVWKYLHNACPASIHHALKWEGYSIVNPDGTPYRYAGP